MEKITVADLATECSVHNQVVLSEAKRLGLYVFSPAATIDTSVAETIRKKIFAQREAEEARVAEAEKKKELETAKKAAAKAKKSEAVEEAAPAKPAPAPVKGKKVPKKADEKALEVKKEEEAAPRLSLAPRKGRKHYDRGTTEMVEGVVPAATAAAPARPFEMTPSEVAQAFLADVGVAPVEEPPAPPEEGRAAEAESAGPAPSPEPLPRPPEPAPPATTVTRKVIVPKAKILMRTTTQPVAPPHAGERILRGIHERPPGPRPPVPTRLIRRRKPGKVDTPERAPKVVEIPRPPESPEDYKSIAITEGVTLKELAEKMDIKS